MDETTQSECKKNILKNGKKDNSSFSANTIYMLGFAGAAVYYISSASGFWNIAAGILKAALWPAFLVYGLLKYIAV